MSSSSKGVSSSLVCLKRVSATPNPNPSLLNINSSSSSIPFSHFFLIS